jgi:hypothetical protein
MKTIKTPVMLGLWSSLSLLLLFPAYAQQQKVAAPASYNMHGLLNGEKVYIHIADNHQLAPDSYFFYARSPQEPRRLVVEFPPANRSDVFDVWREEFQGSTSAFWYITSFPAELAIKGYRQVGTVQQKFTLYHVLNIFGTINSKQIRMVLEFNGQEKAGKLGYKGYFYYLTHPQQQYPVTGVCGPEGIEELIQEDEDGDFVAFFEFTLDAQRRPIILWHSADGQKSFPVVLRF